MGMYLFRCCFMHGEALTNLSILHLEFFLVSWIAVFTIEKFGRRQLMMFGAAGMSFAMVHPPNPPPPLFISKFTTSSSSHHAYIIASTSLTRGRDR